MPMIQCMGVYFWVNRWMEFIPVSVNVRSMGFMPVMATLRNRKHRFRFLCSINY
jgi:hypothetical protein